MAKMGAPIKEVNWKTFENLCAIHCTEEEISMILGVSMDTLERRIKETYDCTFAELYKQKAADGKMSLRRTMWDKALRKQDNTMLIWLSKNHLGMKDEVEHTHSGNPDKPVNVKYVWADKAGVEEDSPKVDPSFYDKPSK